MWHFVISGWIMMLDDTLDHRVLLRGQKELDAIVAVQLDQSDRLRKIFNQVNDAEYYRNAALRVTLVDDAERLRKISEMASLRSKKFFGKVA